MTMPKIKEGEEYIVITDTHSHLKMGERVKLLGISSNSTMKTVAAVISKNSVQFRYIDFIFLKKVCRLNRQNSLD